MSNCKCDCAGEVPCRVTEEQYYHQIADSMPKGIIWEFDDDRVYPKFWRAIAVPFTKLNNYICEVISELNPCTTDDLLHRQADLWGYPVQCIGYPGDSEKLCEWLRLMNSDYAGPTVQFFEELVQFAGVDGVTYDETKHDPAEAGCAQVGCAEATNVSCPCGIVINVPENLLELTQQQTGCCGQAGKPLCERSVPIIECLLNRFMPAHLDIFYNPY